MTSENSLFILVLDDDEDFNLLITTQIKGLGHNITACKTPQDFFTNLKATTPDLCLVDLNIGNIPGAGFQAIRAIRNKLGYEVPLFLISGSEGDEDKEKAKKVGATDFLCKPFQAKDFTDLIDAHGLSFKKMHEEYLLQIPPSYSGGNLVVDFKIKEIREDGITIVSEYNIPEGTYVSLEGEVLAEALQRPSFCSAISKTSFEDTTQLFHSFIAFDSNEQELMFKVKAWLRKQLKNEILNGPEVEETTSNEETAA